MISFEIISPSTEAHCFDSDMKEELNTFLRLHATNVLIGLGAWIIYRSGAVDLIAQKLREAQEGLGREMADRLANRARARLADP
jgi:hypothetical protein